MRNAVSSRFLRELACAGRWSGGRLTSATYQAESEFTYSLLPVAVLERNHDTPGPRASIFLLSAVVPEIASGVPAKGETQIVRKESQRAIRGTGMPTVGEELVDSKLAINPRVGPSF